MWKYELKKVFSRIGNKIAMLLLFILLAVVCYLAISGVPYVNQEGETQKGIAAAHLLRKEKKEWAGELTEEKIRKVIIENDKINRTEEYQSKDIKKKDIAYGQKQGFSDIRDLIGDAFSEFRSYDYYKVDSLEPEDAERFYSNRQKQLKEWLASEAKDMYTKEEKAFLTEKYEEIDTPFFYDYADGWKQLFEFAPTILMGMVLILAFPVAGIFSCETQYHADSIFYTAYHGRGKAVAAKVQAGFYLVTGLYWLIVLLYTGIVLTALGFDGAKCQIQAGRAGWKSFYNITNWQEYLLVFMGGYVGCLFLLFLTMLVSVEAKSSVLAVTIPFLAVFIPSFISSSNPVFTKFLGIMPDRLLQMNMQICYFDLYKIGTRIVGAAGPLLVIYSSLCLLLCPLIYQLYKKAEVG